jgi:hypothetical protein
MAFLYRIHGLIVSSEIPIPELFPVASDAIPDVIIKLGPAPADIDQPNVRGVQYKSRTGCFQLDLDGIARYQVIDGDSIILSPAKDHDPMELRQFLLTSPMGALLHQRGTFVLHASAVAKDGISIILAGASGCGKSSLAAAFWQRGYRLLCDEIAAIHEDPTGEFWVKPEFPGVQLWSRAARELAIDLGKLKPIRKDIQKYAYSMMETFSQEAARADRIFLLSRGGVLHHQIRELKGHEKFRSVLHSTYLARLITGDVARSHFDVGNRLVSAARIFSFSFPEQGITIQEAASLIEEEALRWEK